MHLGLDLRLELGTGVLRRPGESVSGSVRCINRITAIRSNEGSTRQGVALFRRECHRSVRRSAAFGFLALRDVGYLCRRAQRSQIGSDATAPFPTRNGTTSRTRGPITARFCFFTFAMKFRAPAALALLGFLRGVLFLAGIPVRLDAAALGPIRVSCTAHLQILIRPGSVGSAVRFYPLAVRLEIRTD